MLCFLLGGGSICSLMISVILIFWTVIHFGTFGWEMAWDMSAPYVNVLRPEGRILILAVCYEQTPSYRPYYLGKSLGPRSCRGMGKLPKLELAPLHLWRCTHAPKLNSECYAIKINNAIKN